MSVVQEVESLELVSRAVFDLDGDGDVTLGEIAEVLNVDSMVLDLDGDGELSADEIQYGLETAPRPTLWKEAFFKSTSDIQAEALIVRERLLQEHADTITETSFQMDTYFVKIFGRNLQEMVELSPLTWLPLLPVVALGQSIDLSRDIVSARSTNAFESCGEFITSPGYLAAQTIALVLACVWGVWNFWKMVQIKGMLLPTLIRTPPTVPDGPSEAVLLPPRYEDDYFLQAFDSSPFPIGAIESLLGKKGRHRHEALFGTAGRAGPHLYQNSIKLHTCFVVAQLVFVLGQIVTRDLAALVTLNGGAAGDAMMVAMGRPEALLPELTLYGVYSILLAGQLWIVPKTFLDYSLVTSIERLIEVDVLTESCLLDGECELPVTTTTTTTDSNQSVVPSSSANGSIPATVTPVTE